MEQQLAPAHIGKHRARSHCKSNLKEHCRLGSEPKNNQKSFNAHLTPGFPLTPFTSVRFPSVVQSLRHNHPDGFHKGLTAPQNDSASSGLGPTQLGTQPQWRHRRVRGSPPGKREGLSLKLQGMNIDLVQIKNAVVPRIKNDTIFFSSSCFHRFPMHVFSSSFSIRQNGIDYTPPLLNPRLRLHSHFNLHVPSSPHKEVIVLITADAHVGIDVICGH